MPRNTILFHVDDVFFMSGTDGMLGALAAILYYEETFMGKTSIRTMKPREREESSVILDCLLLGWRQK